MAHELAHRTVVVYGHVWQRNIVHRLRALYYRVAVDVFAQPGVVIAAGQEDGSVRAAALHHAGEDLLLVGILVAAYEGAVAQELRRVADAGEDVRIIGVREVRHHDEHDLALSPAQVARRGVRHIAQLVYSLPDAPRRRLADPAALVHHARHRRHRDHRLTRYIFNCYISIFQHNAQSIVIM